MGFNAKPSKAAIVLLLLASTAHSNAADQKKSDDKPAATFTSQTELVLVPTVVTDKKGDHVPGLTKDDFQVFDLHHPQEIKIFEEVTTDSGQLQTTGSTLTGEFSNHAAEAGSGPEKPHRLTIIAFDLINMPTLKQSSARKALLQFLAETASSGEPTAVYSITQNGVTVVSDFTTDPKVLAEALKKLKNGHEVQASGGQPGLHEGLEYNSPADPNMMSTLIASTSSNATADTDPGGSKQMSDILFALERFDSELQLNMSSQERRYSVNYTLEGMHQIAQACAAIPGRKSLIWVGGGFPFDISPTDMLLDPNAVPAYASARSGLDQVLPLYLRLWRDFNDAQVAVYPIDVRGMVDFGFLDPSVRNTDAQYTASRRFQGRQTYETDRTFADATGGKPFYGSNDLKAGFEQAAKDSSHYYLIGYYIKPDDTKIRWHEISVKSPRKGIDIRARGGYFYRPTNADLQASRQHDLSAGLLSPVDFTGIPMKVRWVKNSPPSTGDARRVPFEIILPADFAQVDDGDNNHVVTDIVVQAKTPDGKPVGQLFTRTMDAHLQAAQLEQVKKKGLTYASSIDLPAGQYVVRFVVRDGLNGHMGSVAAPLKVD